MALGARPDMTETASSPDNRNLSERSYDLLRRDILHGKLFPGEKLHIDNLSERYGIGKVPLREALNRLSSEGLAERKSHRGFFVAPISMSELVPLPILLLPELPPATISSGSSGSSTSTGISGVSGAANTIVLTVCGHTPWLPRELGWAQVKTTTNLAKSSHHFSGRMHKVPTLTSRNCHGRF